MNHKKNVLVLGLIAIALVILGFIIDGDESYDSMWQTIFEFCWLSIGLFMVMSILYFIVIGIERLLTR